MKPKVFKYLANISLAIGIIIFAGNIVRYFLDLARTPDGV